MIEKQNFDHKFLKTTTNSFHHQFSLIIQMVNLMGHRRGTICHPKLWSP